MFNMTRKIEDVTIVFVTAQFECGWLIREGRRIADETNTKLYVVNVQKKCEWGKKFCKELNHLLMISKNLDAEMLIYFSDNPITILNDCIKRSNVKHVVLGNSNGKTHNFEEHLYVKSKEIKVHVCKY